jgi:hypothetical protein
MLISFTNFLLDTFALNSYEGGVCQGRRQFWLVNGPRILIAIDPLFSYAWKNLRSNMYEVSFSELLLEGRT